MRNGPFNISQAATVHPDSLILKVADICLPGFSDAGPQAHRNKFTLFCFVTVKVSLWT